MYFRILQDEASGAVSYLLADLDTPLSVYLKLANGSGAYLLESVEGGETWGRFSIIGLPCLNRYTLTGMLTRLGCEVVDLGVARDTREALSAALESAVGEVDAIITSGGVSVGEADFVREILASLGEVTFWKIAMKPGRPMAFGRLTKGGRDTLLFGLPGNPVATMITFYFFAREALLTLMGASPVPAPIRFDAISGSAMKKQPGRTEYQRGILELRDGRWHATVTGAQGSGILRSMCDANCIIVLDDDVGNVAVGDTVGVIPFEGLI